MCFFGDSATNPDAWHEAIHREVEEEVQAAMRFAEESSEPDNAALYEDFFVENPEELVRDGSESAD